MRRGNVIFLVIILVIVGYLTNECRTLISLLFEDATAYAISPKDLPPPGTKDNDNGTGTNLIPKIIHQTYINSSIPAKWQEGQQACVNLHSDYEYILWTDEKSRDFIKKEYNWFLKTFDAYSYPIQRADTIRYFVLYHYGGIYIDLDDGCNRRLDPLLRYPAWLRFTTPTGISNDAMGAVPHHPFFKFTIDLLEEYNRSWVLGYITVMGSTGPLFLSVVWKRYLWDHTKPSEIVRILMPAEYKNHPWSFFNIAKGSSWHGKDAQTIFWMLKHWVFLTVAGFLIAGVVGIGLWFAWSEWVMNTGKRTSHGRKKSFWKRVRGGGNRYELVDRMA
ncbi:hypothetical protein HYALB_00007041 [Hymenoscyphus albidus]|uniref:Mannosyl phosphorylinositol ceramide synthase SUR1 n=1 Tax=Hymenoscyphus albidus TaxID=595503 RepID=A0A9N9LRN2_9HELO|nr:hypothetical protein HYALB_00007041 [Hymenoscyphus albidus]